MTTLSNEAIVAELGWTMQAIIDNNGGQVPMYWVSVSFSTIRFRVPSIKLLYLAYFSDPLMVISITGCG